MAYGPFFAGTGITDENAVLTKAVEILSAGGFDIALADSEGGILHDSDGNVLVGDIKVMYV